MGEAFDRLFPEYLVMGMTPEQYWDGENGLKKAYRTAYRTRMRNEERIRDQAAWLHGVYIRDALMSVALLVNGFVPKGAKPTEYPNKPRLETYEEEERAAKKATAQKKREEKQMQLAMAMFQSMAADFNKGFERRQKEKERAGAIAT